MPIDFICNARRFEVNQHGVDKFFSLCTKELLEVSSKKDKDELKLELDNAVSKATIEIKNGDNVGLYETIEILCKLSEKIDDTITKGKASKLLVPTGVFGVGVLTVAGIRHLYKKWRNKSEKAIVAKKKQEKEKEELEKAKEELEKAIKAAELEKAIKAAELEKAKAAELEKAIKAAELNLNLPNLTLPMTKEQKKLYLTDFLRNRLSLKNPNKGVQGGMRKKKPFVSKKKKFQKNNK